MRVSGTIRVGVGGWTYEPWRGVFYPVDLPQKRELEHASRRLTTIEINGTYYSTFKPDSWRKWRDETPDDFVFAVKASRYCTNRRVLGEAGEAIARFMGQGLIELGEKLGPINWQFMPTKAFDAGDIDAFLALLPRELDGRPVRHVLEVRHRSFESPAFVELLEKHRAAAVFTDAEDWPTISDLTADFVYARLQRSAEDVETGYRAPELDRWATVAADWSEGREPEGLANLTPGSRAAGARDVFVFFISGAKERNPAAAEALIERVGRPA